MASAYTTIWHFNTDGTLADVHDSLPETSPVATALSDGTYLVTWKDPALNAVHFNANGAAIGSPIYFGPSTQTATSVFASTALSNGGFALSWVDLGGLKIQRYDSANHVVGGVIATGLSTGTVTGLTGGRFAITQAAGTDPDTDVYTTVVDPAAFLDVYGYDAQGRVIQAALYGDDGRLIEQDAYDPATGKLMLQVINRIGANGILAEQDAFDVRGSKVFVNTYDAAGLVIEQDEYRGGSPYLKVFSTYDANGHLTQKRGADVPGSTIFTNVYDASEHLTEQTGYDAQTGAVTIKVVSHWAVDGHLTEQDTYDAQGDISYRNLYDANGALIEQDRFDKASGDTTLRVVSARAPDGHLTRQDATDAQGHVIYTNYYDATGTLYEQDGFDASGHLSVLFARGSTQPSHATLNAGDPAATFTILDGAALELVNGSAQVSSVSMSAGAYLSLQGAGATSVNLGTGVERVAMVTTAGEVTINQTTTNGPDGFIFYKGIASGAAGHVSIQHFAPDDDVTLVGYGAGAFTETHPGDSTLWTLSDGATVLFNHVAQVTQDQIHII